MNHNRAVYIYKSVAVAVSVYTYFLHTHETRTREFELIITFNLNLYGSGITIVATDKKCQDIGHFEVYLRFKLNLIIP